MTNPIAEQLSRKLSQVTALLAKADSTEFPDEAKLFRAKAQELMQKYRIEEEDLIAVDPLSIQPEFLLIELCKITNPFEQSYLNLFYYVATHSEVEVAFKRNWKTGVLQAHVIGYPGDLRQVEYLFNSARLVFGERLEPQIKPELDEATNIYRLRQAGIERQRVARMIWGEEIGRKSAAHAKVGKIYKAECERRGESIALDGKGISLKDFRAAYAREFVWKVDERLRDARDAFDGTHGAVTLHGRKERVMEAFYTRFPEYRPSTEVVVAKDAPKAKQAKPRKRTKADMERSYRMYHSPAALAGGSAGKSAAEEVELKRQPRQAKLQEPESTSPAGMMKEISNW